MSGSGRGRRILVLSMTIADNDFSGGNDDFSRDVRLNSDYDKKTNDILCADSVHDLGFDGLFVGVRRLC